MKKGMCPNCSMYVNQDFEAFVVSGLIIPRGLKETHRPVRVSSHVASCCKHSALLIYTIKLHRSVTELLHSPLIVIRRDTRGH